MDNEAQDNDETMMKMKNNVKIHIHKHYRLVY